MQNTIEFLAQKELKLLHNATLEILENPGMVIMVPEFLEVLEKNGCKVDYDKQRVTFPSALIEKTIEMAQRIPLPPTMATRPPNATPGLQIGLHNSCLNFFDYENNSVREPTATDLMKIIELGEALDEVSGVYPVICAKDFEDKVIPAQIRVLETTNIVAKNSSKPDVGEIWDLRELDFLIRMGCVLRGGWEEYKKSPLFLCCKETISPLKLDGVSGSILLALAKKQLPCIIVPMPIMGATAPVTPASAIVIANAEILGVMAAIKALDPEIPVGGGVLGGVLDMKTAVPSYAAPEACLIDAGMANLYENLYKIDFIIGVGYTDGKYPGVQASIERALKITFSRSMGKIAYPVGILDRGKTFSPEQALIDIETCKSVQRFFGAFPVNEETVALEVIRKVGIGGHFLLEDHTLKNFRKEILSYEIFDHQASRTLSEDKEQDILKKAHRKYKAILEKSEPFQLDKAKSEEIDEIVREGKEVLLG